MAHTRKSVPVDAETQELLRALCENDSREHAALTSLTRGADATAQGRRSEVAVLAALVDLGKRTLQEKVLEEEYRAMAAEQNDEDCAVRVALRRRRRLSSRVSPRPGRIATRRLDVGRFPRDSHGRASTRPPGGRRP